MLAWNLNSIYLVLKPESCCSHANSLNSTPRRLLNLKLCYRLPHVPENIIVRSSNYSLFNPLPDDKL